MHNQEKLWLGLATVRTRVCSTCPPLERKGVRRTAIDQVGPRETTRRESPLVRVRHRALTLGAEVENAQDIPANALIEAASHALEPVFGLLP